ncbi:hypothetical protein F511_41136 [Dorcoceras hygrometricum]|uniref:Uncharacterized protein n=1 Tax=Dorcoceras hygrometricum TaxID=472368 RepID=A0A2Z7AJR7_9LAMI|nr:hypothetical protein F511_41136 [Dorcoceras hygrometricum]
MRYYAWLLGCFGELICVLLAEHCLVSCIDVIDFLPGCEGERRYRTLISLMGSLANMRRVVNYHSSWARFLELSLSSLAPLLVEPSVDIRCLMHSICILSYAFSLAALFALPLLFIRKFLFTPIRDSRGFGHHKDSVKNKEIDIQLVETETGKEIDPESVADVGQIPSDEESLSIDDLLKRIPEDMMLPSVTAAKATKIKFGRGITINGVTDGDCLRRLAVLKSVRDIAAKEEQVLTWAETDSVQVALQRRLYIVAKYRELLLRKFLEAHRANFSFSQPWSAMALQIIDLLSPAHSTSMKNLLMQKQALKLEWTRPCCATLFEGANFDRGFYIPRKHKTIFSTCWVRNLRFIGGSWLVEDGYD